jgi:hypothetical protein
LAARWLAAQHRPGLDTLTVTAALAAGTWYRDRHTSTDMGRAGSAARVESLRNGRLPESMKATEKQPAAASGGEMGQVIAFPAGLRPEDLTTPQKPAPKPMDLSALSQSHRQVYDLVAAGIDRPSDIEARMDLSRRRIADILRDLVEGDYLTQPRYGRYQAAA